MDKVASSPALVASDDLNEDEKAALALALGNGLEAVAAVVAGEEQCERHTVADLPDFHGNNTQPITVSESRLHTLTELTEYSEYTSSLDSLTDFTKSESEHHPMPDIKEVDPPDIFKEIDGSNDYIRDRKSNKDDGENQESNHFEECYTSPNVYKGKSQSPVSNKVASFFIGDEQGVSESQDLIPAPSDLALVIPMSPEPAFSDPPLSPICPTTPPVRRVQLQIEEQEKMAKKIIRPPPEFTPPDGGYGWVVAFAACVVNMWIVGLIKSYGVLYVHISNAFPEASAYHIAWVPALLSTVGLLIAPVTGMLCRKFTSRRVSFVGGLLCGLGLVLGAMATNINHLILTLGMLTGLGGGLTTTPGILIVSLYFEKRRALASAICVSGNAFGGFFQPMLIDWLLEMYGLRGTLLVLGALQFNICAASMLYRPIREHARIQEQEREQLEKLKPVDSSCNVDGEKLLPTQPSMPDVPFHTSAPNTPLNRPTAIWNKVVRKRLESISQEEDEELRRQVSFLRSSSMMNSIPDLSEYARSWTMTDEAFMRSHGSFTSFNRSRGSINRSSGSIRCHPSKSSLRKFSFGSSKGSKGSMDKLSSTEVKRPQMLRLMSEDKPRPPGVYTSHGSRNSLTRVHSEGRPGGLLRKVSLRQKAKTMMKEGIIQEQDNESVKSLETQGSSQSLKDKGMPQLGRIAQLKEEANLYDRKENDLVVEPAMEPLSVSAINETANKVYNDSTAMDTHTEKDKMLEKEEKDEMANEEDTVSVESVKHGSCFYVFRCCDCNLMRNPLFWVMAISVSCMAAGAPHLLFFMPAYATSVGIASTATTSLLSISSLVDLFGRLGIGFISDLGFIRPSYIYILCSGLAAFSVIMLPLTSSFVGLAVLLGIYGFGVGAWFVLIPTLLASHHGAIRLASSYGMTRLFQGIVNFISPQVCGILIDVTGGYESTFYYMGIFMLSSSIIVLFEKPLVSQQKKKEELLKKQLQEENNVV